MSPIAMGTNTDPYQPIEREKMITRQILQVLQRFGHPVTIVTKNALITRDIDILAEMAQRRLAKVAVSITTLDPKLARAMEPRAVSPARRLATVKALSDAGIPTAVMTAPMIPALNDMEMEAILEAAANVGASSAGLVFIRLPLEITQLFQEWLEAHVPGKATHIMSLIKQCRGGATYQSQFGTRMTGEGPYARLLRDRFRKAVAKYGLDKPRAPLDLTVFKAPPGPGDQMRLL
jgi:DNA repair photolyase